MLNTLRALASIILGVLPLLTSQPSAAAVPNAGVVINDGNGTVILPDDIFPRDPNSVPNRGNPIGFPDPILNPGGFPIIGADIAEALVPEQFSCPLFQGDNTKELTQAIDSLTVAMTAIQVTPECSGSGASKGEIEATAAGLKDAVKSIGGMMTAADPAAIAAGAATGAPTASVGEIEKQMNTVVGSIKKLGDTLKGNSLLNPMCGKKVSAIKVATSFNDIVLGMAPLALFAVTFNPALAPLLKWVVGTVAVSGGFSVLGQIIDSGDSIDMEKVENRTAYVKNLCQYLKVLRKYQLMQEARGGKVKQILEQLDLNVTLYRNSLQRQSSNLAKTLGVLGGEKSRFAVVEKANKLDIQMLNQTEDGINKMKSPAFVCSIASNLVTEANQGRFPKTVFTNYRSALEIAKQNNQNDPSYQSSLILLRSLEQSDSIHRNQLAVAANNLKSGGVEACTKVAREWLTFVRDVATQTKQMIDTRYAALEAKFMTDPNYKKFFYQSENLAKGEALTQQVKQVVQLAEQEWQAVEDSNTSIQMRKLKQTFFGQSPLGLTGKWCMVTCSNSPTGMWLRNTFQEYENAKARFSVYMDTLHSDSFYQQIIDGAELRKRKLVYPGNGKPIYLPDVVRKQELERKTLANIDLRRFPRGSAYHQNVCKNLKGAWLNMDEARVHLGAVQYLCKMISPILDHVDIEATIANFCMDDVVPGQIRKYSRLNQELQNLKTQEINKTGLLVKSKMDELGCPIQTN